MSRRRSPVNYLLCARLDDVDVLASNGITDLHNSLPIGLVEHGAAPILDSHTLGHHIGQIRMRVAIDDDNVRGGGVIHVAPATLWWPYAA